MDSEQCTYFVLKLDLPISPLDLLTSIVNVVQLPNHRRGKNSCHAFGMNTCLTFFMSGLIDINTCWLILCCTLWVAPSTYLQLQRHMYSIQHSLVAIDLVKNYYPKFKYSVAIIYRSFD